MTIHRAPPAATTRWRTLLPTLLDLVIPTAGYFLLHWAGLPDIWALTIAGSATGVNALVHTIRRADWTPLACWSWPRSPCRSPWRPAPAIPG
jgi:hypothetical protein